MTLKKFDILVIIIPDGKGGSQEKHISAVDQCIRYRYRWHPHFARI